MLLPLILSVYLLSHLNIPIFLFITLTLAPAPAHARRVHRWGSLASDHVHDHAHAQLDVPTITLNTNTNTNEPDRNPDILDPLPSTKPSYPLAPAPAAPTDEEQDDWLKWHRERHLQQDMRRKLECRTVEFGRCDIQRFRQRRGVEVKNGVVGDGREKQRQEDEFVGKRLPRNLQDWLAREGGAGS